MSERERVAGPGAPGAVKRITSLTNPIIKEIRGLNLGKNRKASGRFIAEGLKLVADGVEAGWDLDTLVYADEVADQPLVSRLAARSHAAGGTVVAVNRAVLGKISRRDNGYDGKTSLSRTTVLTRKLIGTPS